GLRGNQNCPHQFFSHQKKHVTKMSGVEPNYTEYTDYPFDYEKLTTPCDKGEVRNFTKVFLPIAYSIICVLGLVGNIFVVM
ncbi:chemokine (C-C motif) receptor 6, partial [Chelydra serpentina]